MGPVQRGFAYSTLQNYYFKDKISKNRGLDVHVSDSIKRCTIVSLDFSMKDQFIVYPQPWRGLNQLVDSILSHLRQQYCFFFFVHSIM